MANKGKPSRKHVPCIQKHVEQAQPTVEQNTTSATRKRSDKLARQLKSLMTKDANWATVMAKADELQKSKWRESRVADLGRKTGFKPSAPLVSRRSALIAAC